MATSYWLGIVGAVLVAVVVVELLRRRSLRGKYAVLWLALSFFIAVVAVAPSLLGAAADALGVQVPANLLFFAGTLLSLLVIMQLSYESGKLEEETRSLAEEIGILRVELEELRAAMQAGRDVEDD